MSDGKNVHGLSRDIPAGIAREIRRQCGFGCIVCGNALYDYEHLDPEFKNAKEHDPTKIFLVCPNHHREKGSFISVETLKKAAASPFCKKAGFSHLDLDIGHLTIEVGPFTSKDCPVVLDVKGEKVIWFEPPEEQGGPPRFNATFYDEKGHKIFWIENNRWHGSVSNFDIVMETGQSGAITIRRKLGEIIFDAEMHSPHTLKITTLECFYKDVKIKTARKGDVGDFEINENKILIHSNIYIEKCAAAVAVT